MIGRIIHYIYCLPIREAVIWALLATGLLFWLHRLWGQKKWWRPAAAAALCCWATVVVFHTLLDRGGENVTASLIPFQTYITVYNGGEKELLRSAFMNVLLFYPGGLLLPIVFPRWKGWLILLGFVLASAGIELGQYYFQLGFAEVDDILHNGLGALLGLAATRQYRKHNRQARK